MVVGIARQCRAALVAGIVAVAVPGVIGCQAGPGGRGGVFGPQWGGGEADETETGSTGSASDDDGEPEAATWGGQSEPSQSDGEMPDDDGTDTGEPPAPVDPLAPRLAYTFDDAAGATVANSGALAGYDLTIAQPAAVTWLASALRIDAPTLISGPGPAGDYVDAVITSGAYTVETWIETARLDQTGPARIVTLSLGSDVRNFTLGQGLVPQGEVDFLARVRAPGTDANGRIGDQDPIHAGPGDIDLQRTHLVLTREPSGQTALWIDGAIRSSAALPGSLSGWSTDFALHLAGEAGKPRPWLGTLHYVALYDRALTAAEIAAHGAAGPP